MSNVNAVEWNDGEGLDGLIVHGINPSKTMVEAAVEFLDDLGDDSELENEQRDLIRTLLHRAICTLEMTGDMLNTFRLDVEDELRKTKPHLFPGGSSLEVV